MTQPLFNFRFPLSGDIVQDIEPHTFFGAISPDAGQARLERHIALDVASYGTQLSAVLKLLDQLLDPAARKRLAPAAVQEFDAVFKQVKDAKEQHKHTAAAAARQSLERLKRVDEPAYRRLVRSLQDE